MFTQIYILVISCLFAVFCPLATPYTVTSTEIKDLESNTEPEFALEAQDWIVPSPTQTPVYTTCKDTVLLGGYGVFSGVADLSRLYTGMGFHKSVNVDVTFWLIDVWTSTNSISFTIKEGSTNLIQKSIKVDDSFTWPGDLCGDPSAYDISGVTVSARVPHTGTDLTLSIKCASTNTPINGHCGFRDVKITLLQEEVTASSLCKSADSPNVLTQPCACGKYLDTTPTCQSCNPACATCFGPGAGDCSSCNIGYFSNGPSSCSQCSLGCASCTGTSSTQCTSCKTGFYLYPNLTCVAGCVDPYQVSGTNECVFKCSSSKYYYSNNASCEQSCPSPFIKRQEGLEKFCDSPCSQQDYLLSSGSCSTTCHAPMKSETINQIKYCINSNENEDEKGTLQSIKETTDLVLNVGLIISSIASMGDSFSIIDGTVSRMFQYIKYLNISYSQELERVLISWSSSLFSIKIGPSAPSDIKEESMYRPLSTIFTKYGVYPSFLANFWNDGIMIWSTCCLFLFLGIIEYLTNRIFKKSPRLRYVIRKLRVISQQFLLMLTYTTFGDIAFYSILEYRSTRSGLALSNVSLCASILQMLAGLGILALQIKLLGIIQRIGNKSSNSQALKKFNHDHEGCQVFFNDFKDQSLGQQGFLLFFISRSLLLILVLTTLFEYPLVQTIIIVVLNVIMLIFLVIKRPFKHIVNEVQQLSSELALLVVNVAVLAMAILDAKGYEAVSVRKSLGYLIIILNIIFNFASLVFLAIMAYEFARDLYRERKKKQSNQNKTDQSQAQIVDTSRSLQLPISQLSTSTIELDSSTRLPISAKRERLKQAQSMGKLKHEGEIKIHPENPHDASLQGAARKPPLSKKEDPDLEALSRSDKALKKAISISNVDPYNVGTKTKTQQTNPSRHKFYEPNSDASIISRDTERSLLNNHEDVPSSAGLKKAMEQEIKRTKTFAEKLDSSFKSKPTDVSPVKIEPNLRTFKHSNTAVLESSVPNLKSTPMGLENRVRDTSPFTKSNSVARFNHAQSLRSNDVRTVSEVAVPVTTHGNEMSAHNSQAMSFAAELAKKINLKREGTFNAGNQDRVS